MAFLLPTLSASNILHTIQLKLAFQAENLMFPHPAKIQNNLNLNSNLNDAISCLSLVLSLTISCFKLCFSAPHSSCELYINHIIYLFLHLFCLYATSHFSSLSQSQSSFHESTQVCYLLQNHFTYMSCHFPFQISSSSPLHIPVMALTILFSNLYFCELCSPFTDVRNLLATYFFQLTSDVFG